jgi:hypothetical protein
MKNKTKCRLVTYGLQGEPDVLGSGDTILYSDKNEPEGLIFRADADGKSLPVTMEGVFGRNHIYASLAALALSFGFKWNMVLVSNGFWFWFGVQLK